VYFFNVHLASPHVGLEAVLDDGGGGASQMAANSELRWRQAEELSRWAAEMPGPVLLAGDFNTPADSPLFRENFSRFADGFATAGLGWGYTYYTRRTALRIDHILAGTGWHVHRCWVGPALGSPHRPLLADLSWMGATTPVCPVSCRFGAAAR
jgi:endonuclease/exonuclease/phosphatase (EEP) superfamily protein YafD